MNDLLQRYYQLILKDEKYLKEYIFKDKNCKKKYAWEKEIIERNFIWRKVNSKKGLEKITNDKKAFGLITFNSYYGDETGRLLERYLDVDFEELSDEEHDLILSDENLEKILKQEDAPRQLKECIMLEKESRKICEEMYYYLHKLQAKDRELKEINQER